MARTKKADQEKSTSKTAQNADQEPETAEQAGGASQEPETAEQAGGASQEPDMFANLPNPCVYCGPSAKGVARQYTTYQGGIPGALRKFIKEHPETLGLIVSTGAFPAMRRRLETPGTPEAELYRAAKEELRRGHPV